MSNGCAAEQRAKRRKVRKGTHSCWECRRRKIRCQFTSPDDAVCIGCTAKGSICRSQELDDDAASSPWTKADPPLDRRLDRLEEMMERLIDRVVPGGQTGTSEEPPIRSTSAASERAESFLDVLDHEAAGDGPIAAALVAMRHSSAPSLPPDRSATMAAPAPEPAPAIPAPPSRPASPAATTAPPRKKEFPPAKHFWVSTVLLAVFPPQQALNAIIAASPARPCVTNMFHSQHDWLQGRGEHDLDLTIIPPPSSHPTILAKRLLQVLVCIQQLPVSFDWDRLGAKESLSDTMTRMNTTATLVTTNDDLVGCVEGLQCLILHGYFHSNAGNLRKAWMSFRRALSLGQLMGIDHGSSCAFRSCKPAANPKTLPTAEFLWYRIVDYDRNMTLLLNLPLYSTDEESVNAERINQHPTPVERLRTLQTVLSGQIIRRNQAIKKGEAKPEALIGTTQTICLELDTAAKQMDASWWRQPPLGPLATIDEIIGWNVQVSLQVHHSMLLILLHLPYMLREPDDSRYDFSKTVCVRSSRAILARFVAFRSLNASAYAFRRADLAAVIAAMTLATAYLVQRASENEAEVEARRLEDKALVESASECMESVAHLNGDRLSREAVGLFEKLLSILDRPTIASTTDRRGVDMAQQRTVRFAIPYLGIVSLRPSSPRTNRGPPGTFAPPQRNAEGPSPPTLLRTTDPISTPSSLPITPVPQSMEDFIPFLMSVPAGSGPEPMPGYKTPPETTAGTEHGPGSGPLPELVAEASECALQGIDATYWALLDGSADAINIL